MKWLIIPILSLYISVTQAYTLNVLSNDTVKILNINPVFEQGMNLESGTYKLQISNKFIDIKLNKNSLILPKSMHVEFKEFKIAFIGLSQNNILLLPFLGSLSVNKSNNFIQETDLFEWINNEINTEYYKFEYCLQLFCIYEKSRIKQRLMFCEDINLVGNCDSFILNENNKKIPLLFENWVIPNVLPVFKSRYISL
ncbi:MAG: hypothetical protein HRU38_24650 [Saccharospirillaceae bacterium]|nr:hypothetical protein [Saccharospirillaceae bacterium]